MEKRDNPTYIKLNKYLKYLLSLFLVFAMIASDGASDSQSKSADYYQVSQVSFGKELEIRKSRFYVFNQPKAIIKISFLIPLTYLELKTVFSVQTRLLLELRTLIYQNLQSFINQSVFINEIITSNNSLKSLYKA